MTQNFKPIFPYVFQHADSTQIDSRSKRKLFCAPRRARAWAKSVLASPAQGHSSQIWVCHRGYPSLTQNFKPIFPYVFQHADPTQIDSRSKRKLFCAPRRARAWAKSVLASPAYGHSSQIWVCHRGYPWAGLARTDFAQARARRGAQKSFRFDRESIWVESAC